MTVFRNAWVKLSTNTNCLFGYISQTSSSQHMWQARLHVYKYYAFLIFIFYINCAFVCSCDVPKFKYMFRKRLVERCSDKVYDWINGTTCHQCRQKTIDTKTTFHNKNCREVLWLGVEWE